MSVFQRFALAGAAIALTACGGSGGGQMSSASLVSDGNFEAVSNASSPEGGPPTKILPAASGSAAKVALFPSGRAFYSPDGYNLGGGGSTTQANGAGGLKVIDIEPAAGGIDVLFSSGQVYLSPDGQNLAGGGSTVKAYGGDAKITQLFPVGGGIDAVLDSGDVYFSPDGNNLGGGGGSVHAYTGKSKITQIIGVGTGAAAVTLFDDGTAYYSPDNRNLGGGGNTVSALGPAHAAVTGIVKVSGGIITTFSGDAMYRSPDGQNLSGGGATVALQPWDTSPAQAAFGPRDSAPGVSFLGHLWLSGGYRGSTGSDSCFSVCSYFDLWTSTDLGGTTWGATPSFATASSPNPRDASSVVNNGVQDAPVPTDFYDAYSPLLVYNSRLWAIGKTVWSTADGSTWQRTNLADGVTAAPGPVSGRAGENSRAIAFNGSVYFLQPDTGEVYRTPDPASGSWTDLGAIAGFTPRCGAAAFVLAGQLWIEGGGACDYTALYPDYWSSADGTHWAKHTAPLAWSSRMWPCVSVRADGILWLAGGYAPTDWNASDGRVTVRYGANHSDVWYTRDAIHWMQFKADNGTSLPDGTALEPRHAATCYATQGGTPGSSSLVVIAGTGGANPDDSQAGVINSIRILPLPLGTTLP